MDVEKYYLDLLYDVDFIPKDNIFYGMLKEDYKDPNTGAIFQKNKEISFFNNEKHIVEMGKLKEDYKMPNTDIILKKDFWIDFYKNTNVECGVLAKDYKIPNTNIILKNDIFITFFDNKENAIKSCCLSKDTIINDKKYKKDTWIYFKENGEIIN